MSLPPGEEYKIVYKTRGVKLGWDTDKAVVIGPMFHPIDSGNFRPEELCSMSERKISHAIKTDKDYPADFVPHEKRHSVTVGNLYNAHAVETPNVRERRLFACTDTWTDQPDPS